MCPQFKNWSYDLASTSAESSQQLDKATLSQERDVCCPVPPEIVEIKLYASARVNLLYRRRSSFEELTRKGELVNLQLLKDVLHTKITKHERRALELCVLMLSVCQKRSSVSGDTCDLAIEVCGYTSTKEMRYDLLCEDVLSLLVLSSVWVTEAASATNLARVAYDVLFNIATTCNNKYLSQYMEHLLDDKKRMYGEDLYWRLRLVHNAFISKKLYQDNVTQLLTLCLEIANCQSGTIYVTELLSDILVALWTYKQVDPNELPPRYRCLFMAKLLLAGFVHQDMVTTLVTTATHGEYSERKVALSALYKASKMNILPYGVNENIFLEMGDTDLGMLSVHASMLNERDSVLSYLEQLYIEVARRLCTDCNNVQDGFNKAKDGIIDLISGDGNLKGDTKIHLHLAVEKYFSFRDITQAISVAYRRLHELGRRASIDSATSCIATRSAFTEKSILLLLYLATLRVELIPYVIGVIDQSVQSEGIRDEVVRFCLSSILAANSNSIFLQQFVILACKVFNVTIKQYIMKYGHSTILLRQEMDCLMLDILRAMNWILNRCKSSIKSCRSIPHVGSTLASVAVYVNTVYWGRLTMDISHELSMALVRMLQACILKEREENIENPRYLLDEGVEYVPEIIGYCSSAFEIICHAIVPSVKLVRSILTVTWHSKHAIKVFNGLQAIASRASLGKRVIRELLLYCIHAKVHTDWDKATLLSFQKFVKLFVLLIQSNECCSKRAIKVDFLKVSAKNGWKAASRLRSRRHGTVRLGGSNNRVVFLRELSNKLKEDACSSSIAICGPLDLLDEHLCVPQSLLDSKIHDCPGE